jgi:large subunit ribosomal protein L15
MIKALPKMRGFKPPQRREFTIVNLKGLEQHFDAGTEVTPQGMVQSGLVRDLRLPIKVLGDGQVTKALKVSAHRFSVGAREKLQAAGGTTQLLEEARRPGRARRAS